MELPAELAGLTYAEQACCSLIQPVMACFTLKGDGQRGLKGHVSFVCREGELLEMVDRLRHVKLDAAVLLRSAPCGQYTRLKVRKCKVLIA